MLIMAIRRSGNDSWHNVQLYLQPTCTFAPRTVGLLPLLLYLITRGAAVCTLLCDDGPDTNLRTRLSDNWMLLSRSRCECVQRSVFIYPCTNQRTFCQHCTAHADGCHPQDSSTVSTPVTVLSLQSLHRCWDAKVTLTKVAPRHDCRRAAPVTPSAIRLVMRPAC